MGEFDNYLSVSVEESVSFGDTSFSVDSHGFSTLYGISAESLYEITSEILYNGSLDFGDVYGDAEIVE